MFCVFVQPLRRLVFFFVFFFLDLAIKAGLFRPFLEYPWRFVFLWCVVFSPELSSYLPGFFFSLFFFSQ